MGKRGPQGINPISLLEVEWYWVNFFTGMKADEPEVFKRLGRIASLRQIYRICKTSKTLTEKNSTFTPLLHVYGQRFLDTRQGRKSVRSLAHAMTAAFFGREFGTIKNLLSRVHRQFVRAQQCVCGHPKEEHTAGDCDVCRCTLFMQPCVCGHNQPLHSESGCKYRCACPNFVGGIMVPTHGKTIPIGDDFAFGDDTWMSEKLAWPSREDSTPSNDCGRCGHLKATHHPKCGWQCRCACFRTAAFRFVPRLAVERRGNCKGKKPANLA
jgi:hypothetical protein